MKTISSMLMTQFIEALAKEMPVIAPVKNEETVSFQPWSAGMEIEWQKNSLIPPKNLFLPQVEVLYKYQVSGVNGEIEEIDADDSPRVLLGIRNCDLHSILLLDKIFLTDDYIDSAYQSRRKNTVIIVLQCSQPLSTCFCTSLGVDPRGGEGADLVLIELDQGVRGSDKMMYDPGRDFGIEARTPKGEEILKKHEDFLSDLQKKPAPLENCNLHLDERGVKEKLPKMFDHSIWADLSMRCLGCGVCTYLCPTCYCFDLQGKNVGEEGFKYRCWDSCMFSDYTMMAGGHNPRPTKRERFRNRFLHKLSYYRERYGELLCTGCGRCLAKCPVHLDITYVAEKIKEAKADVREG
ncbi:MAG: 4Fe-4S dicluster domain-containing protein [Bacillota bacterium]|nr:4Fe-4S dicluster domain-containing protein [Bacillota bacterium]